MRDPVGARRLLLVDDEELVRTAIQKNLESLGYEVRTAPNGKVALDLLSWDPFDLVVTDIRMPEMDGLELLRAIKDSRSIPVVLMTGFSQILEAHEAYQLGADEFIAKPFARGELLAAIERCLGPTPKLGTDESADYCRIGIEDFLSGRQIQFDIFIRLSEQRYVKVATCGEDLTLERVRAYRSKGVHYLHLRRDDFRKYVGFSLALTKAVKDNRAISAEKKRHLLRHTGELILERVRLDGLAEETTEASMAFVEMAVEIVSDDADVFGLLEALNSHVNHAYAHGVAVSFYSVLLAKAVGWNLPANRFKVALGALLHDVGEKELAPELLSQPRHQWTANDVTAFESHPVRGMNLLNQIRSLPGDIALIVKQHHEDCLAQGFPSRLKRAHIHPMARLVAVADLFCRFVVKGPAGPGISVQYALERMAEQSADRLDPQFFAALKSLFAFAPSPVGDGGERGWA